MHKLLAAVAVSLFALTLGLALAEPEPAPNEAPRILTFKDFKELKDLRELKGLKLKGFKLKEMKDIGKLKGLDAPQGDLRTQVAALQLEVHQLKDTVAKLEARIAELDSPHPKLIPLSER